MSEAAMSSFTWKRPQDPETQLELSVGLAWKKGTQNGVVSNLVGWREA
jgi:hypothetical protein